MANNADATARRQREEARVEALAARYESRRLWSYSVALARKYGHTDLLPAKRETTPSVRSTQGRRPEESTNARFATSV